MGGGPPPRCRPVLHHPGHTGHPHDTLDQLATITAPTLVIAGGEDRLVSPAAIRQLADGIPQAHLDGGLREYLTWPDHLLIPLPDDLSDDAGALLEPLGVAIHATGLAHIRPHADVLVLGAGPIGLLLLQVARRAAAGRVFASEPLAHRRQAALNAGADAVWEPEEAAAEIRATTQGRGVDVVIEMAGTDAAIKTAVAAARPGARVVLGGIPDDDRTSFPASVARRKGLTFTMVRRMHETYPQAIALAASGVDLNSLVTARYPLERAARAFSDAAQRQGGKLIVAVSSST